MPFFCVSSKESYRKPMCLSHIGIKGFHVSVDLISCLQYAELERRVVIINNIKGMDYSTAVLMKHNKWSTEREHKAI